MAYRSQIIHINSFNRIRGNPSDFTINFSNALFHNSSGRSRIKVEPIQCVVNRSWYTVDNTNNLFQLSNGVGTINYIIPTGFYNVKTFLALLQSFLPTWTLGYNDITNKYFYKPPYDGQTYTLMFPTIASYLLGFNVYEEVACSYSYPVYSSIPIKMSHESVLLIHSDLPKDNFSSVDNILTSEMKESKVLIKIPITCPPYDNLVWRSNSRDITSFWLSTHYVNDLRIWVTDEFGRSLNLAFDWTMSLRVEYYEEVNQIDVIAQSVSSIKDYFRLLILNNELAHRYVTKQVKRISQ
jgi:hypothetical protein